jgi:hypothetical protein
MGTPLGDALCKLTLQGGGAERGMSKKFQVYAQRKLYHHKEKEGKEGKEGKEKKREERKEE